MRAGASAPRGFVDDALGKGAELLTGGGPPAEMNRGFFFSPTVLGHVPDQARIMSEEPFAPIAPLSTFQSFDDVIARANAVPYGSPATSFPRR